MRKLIMWNLQSLDGYFDGPKPWDLDWHNSVWGPELEALSLEQLNTMGAILFGRLTYEGMASYWTTATTATTEPGAVAGLMNSVPKLVFSHTLTSANWNNTRLVKEPAEVEVARLKGESGKDLYIFGSANLSDTFIKHGLIDEFRICVAPLVLGGGSPLFKPSSKRTALRLLEAKPLKSGGVILRYEPESREVGAAQTS